MGSADSAEVIDRRAFPSSVVDVEVAIVCTGTIRIIHA
jgi:hypothetical protein